MESGENKRKHLEILQGVINRMANNSFLLKGWSVTIVSALFALGIKDSIPLYLDIAFLPVISFWVLDGYFLWQEKLFRRLYEKVSLKNEKDIDYSMRTKSEDDINGWKNAALSKTLKIFHGTIFTVVLITTITTFIIQTINYESNPTSSVPRCCYSLSSGEVVRSICPMLRR
jgi:hypothetical protein